MANNTLNIIVERNVPFLDCLDSVAEVHRLSPEEITPQAVADADALVVRTRTRCDASLLDGSGVRFIASATIGLDHIDLPWCRSHGITVANAPGCNAPAVAQYVFSSLMQVVNRPLSSYCLGIVGVGYVGSIVERWARQMSIPVMLCDPPRQEAEGGNEWHTLDELAAEADIITFHTPLTSAPAPYPTRHLADVDFFCSLRRAPIIINSARGSVINNQAWAAALDAGLCGPAIVDCWEGEPDINRELLAAAEVATPHIAGYSLEGKRRASQMALDAICTYFGLTPMQISAPEPKGCPVSITPAEALRSYDPTQDTAALKANPANFERLRNTYEFRPEPCETFNK